MTSTPLKKHPTPLLQQSSHTWHSLHGARGAGSGHQQAVGTGSKLPQHSTAQPSSAASRASMQQRRAPSSDSNNVTVGRRRKKEQSDGWEIKRGRPRT